ncbi:Hypothetical protein CINCED_3A004199 [Cinara cedri]|nr:Hypothetical protein CINCED_3A004199 [Cinara cedri]
MALSTPESLKLIHQQTMRIIDLYRMALKNFQDDVSLWKQYIKFLIKYKRINTLQKVIDSALLLHGQISDELYVFALKLEFINLKNIQKTRQLYTVGLRIHKNSAALHFEAFKCELASSNKLLLQNSQVNLENEVIKNDPVLNGSIAKVIFESAVENVKNDSDVFFKMYQETIKYDFALDLSNEIKSFMLTAFSKDPNYWDTLAKNELTYQSMKSEKFKIRNCLSKYDEALTILDTEEMWDKYLSIILQISDDTPKTEMYKRNLLRDSMINAHKKKKMKPIHYVKWFNKSSRMLTEEILQLALQTYPNDPNILEIKINSLIEIDKESAYEFFKQNMNHVSPSVWLVMVKNLSNEPQIEEIFNIVFGDKSNCPNEVRQQLGNEYLCWLNKNKSLNDARVVYNKLILNSYCDPSLCKTMITIETEQEEIDIAKIRQHFTLACMQFGKTNIDLWMDRIYFEHKHGSPKFVSSTYHQALTTLNNEESDRFVEEYTLKVAKFNKL